MDEQTKEVKSQIPDLTLTGDWFQGRLDSSKTFIELLPLEKTKDLLHVEMHGNAINDIDAGHFRLVACQDLDYRSIRKDMWMSKNVIGDVSKLIIDPHNDGATFQAGLQFNCLEMPKQSITPLYGITDYQYDHTQGPICSMVTQL